MKGLSSLLCYHLVYICDVVNHVKLMLSAAQPRGVLGGQSMGLRWSFAEGLALLHVCTATGLFLMQSR